MQWGSGMMIRTAFAAATAVLLGTFTAAAAEKIVLAHASPQLSASYAINSSVPLYLKYWEEEGLEVEVVPTPGAAAAMQLVISGQADVAYGSPNAAFAAIQRGAPLKIYFASTRGDIFGLALPTGSGLDSIDDLKGKTVGVSSFASAGTPYLKSLLATAGLTDDDVSIVEVGVGGRAAGALLGKQVDALALWDEAYVQMEGKDISFEKIIKDERADANFSGTLVVSEDSIKNRRQALIGLARGMAKAHLFQSENMEAVARIHWNVYPQSAPREGITDETVAETAKVLAVRKHIQSKDAFGTGRFGDIPAENMTRFQDYLVVTGQLPEAIDPTLYYTNEMIDEINDFDAAKVVEAAKTFKAP